HYLSQVDANAQRHQLAQASLQGNGTVYSLQGAFEYVADACTKVAKRQKMAIFSHFSVSEARLQPLTEGSPPGGFSRHVAPLSAVPPRLVGIAHPTCRLKEIVKKKYISTSIFIKIALQNIR
ncbi:MAG: hypothetical protein D6730_18735, partial [Bacteroidetes bacterium]